MDEWIMAAIVRPGLIESKLGSDHLGQHETSVRGSRACGLSSVPSVSSVVNSERLNHRGHRGSQRKPPQLDYAAHAKEKGLRITEPAARFVLATDS
jgi:hypothetical protein